MNTNNTPNAMPVFFATGNLDDTITQVREVIRANAYFLYQAQQEYTYLVDHNEPESVQQEVSAKFNRIKYKLRTLEEMIVTLQALKN